eukprot:134328-Rhodomonas_salina.2
MCIRDSFSHASTSSSRPHTTASSAWYSSTPLSRPGLAHYTSSTGSCIAYRAAPHTALRV